MQSTFGVVPTFDVPAGTSVGVLARGTLLLWLRAEPLPPAVPVDGGIFTVAGDVRLVYASGRLRAEERTTGRILGEVTGIGPKSRLSAWADTRT
ncbi:hypothetical protein [Pseudonocardia adelaidensis]|uniref:Uncharacterized protein n=1 Tax=Pseudonocardia adelaidensis TaxID=648754 RepID=A0ABP9NXP9_9PSEU